MAFPIPEHLPRKAIPQDVSTHILTKISEVSNKQLTASLAASWISELDETIRQTKDRIHERIHEELPAFERQLASSKSVQTRLLDLTSNVDKLSNSLLNPETGLLPNLLSALRTHSSLAQESSDADILHEALEYLARCNNEMNKLEELVREGELREAVNQGSSVQVLVDEAPEAFGTAEVMLDVKRQFRALLDRTQEQLSEAYSRSVVVSPAELRICSIVQVRQSHRTITLSDIFSSLSFSSLNGHLAPLRRDLISHFINHPLQEPMSSSVAPTKDQSGTPSQTFSLFPLPPQIDSFKSSIGYLRNLFDFLSANLFSALPPSVYDSFPRTLCRPTVTAILKDILVPHLPSSLDSMHPFLALVADAVQFEQGYIINVLRDDERGERQIKAWADNVPSHYGRKRRTDLLATTRTLIISASPDNEQVFRVELPKEMQEGVQPDIIAVQGGVDTSEKSTWGLQNEVETDGSWGLDDGDRPEHPAGKPQASEENVDADENGWEFDDDAETAVEDLPTEGPVPVPKSMEEHSSSNGNGNAETTADDPSDAWGWDEPIDEEEPLPSVDSKDTTTSANDVNGHKLEESPSATSEAQPFNPGDDAEESAWDDPWDDAAPLEPQAPPTPPSPVRLISPAKQPKPAKRLEKFSSKGRRAQSPSLTSSNPASPALASPAFPTSSSMTLNSPRPSSSFPTPSSSNFRSSQLAELPKPLRPSNPALTLEPKPKETFTVSKRAKHIVSTVQSILSEGRELLRSTVFSQYSSGKDKNSHSSPSSLVLQTAPLALDLYRALYPVTFSSALEKPGRSMQFSNDCLFIRYEVEKLGLPIDSALSLKEQVHESVEKMKSLGDWWYDESIERVRGTVLNILQRAEGFVDTGDQEHFDECESVMSDALRCIRSSAFEWKSVLPTSKYSRATGVVVEAALTKILDDVLSLPDIPELDSHRLSELCRILNALEGLFADGTESASMVVAYVPSWLKYSYLSELLEASIADISYLFDEGALIDFEVDELVKLIKALFADTPLRTNTIAKLQRGHPNSAA